MTRPELEALTWHQLRSLAKQTLPGKGRAFYNRASKAEFIETILTKATPMEETTMTTATESIDTPITPKRSRRAKAKSSATADNSQDHGLTREEITERVLRNAEKSDKFAKDMAEYIEFKKMYDEAQAQAAKWDRAVATRIENDIRDSVPSGYRDWLRVTAEFLDADDRLAMLEAFSDDNPLEAESDLEYKLGVAMHTYRNGPRPVVPEHVMAEPTAPELEYVPAAPTPTLDDLERHTPCSVDGLIHPEPNPTFVTSAKVKKLMGSVLLQGVIGTPPNTLMVGPAGCGKTEQVLEFAAHAGLPVLKINCALVREPRDWFGYKTVTGGTIEWVQSQFASAISEGGLVVLLDEINRVSPAVLNSLMPLLDRSRSSFIEEIKETLVVGRETYFFATANIGTEYVGTGRIDKALLDRFGVRIECSYLSEADETKLLVERTDVAPDIANKLAKFASTIRAQAQQGSSQITESVSTRALLEAANLYKYIGVDALDFSILPIFSTDGGANSERSVAIQALQAQFGTLLSGSDSASAQPKK